MCSETSEAVGTTWEHAQLEIQKFLKIRITLLDMVWTISNLAGFGLGHIQPGWIWADHIQPHAGYGLTISRQTEPAGRRGWKNTFLGGFFSVFFPVFCFFIDSLYMTRIF